jgi:TonB-linked SusC/RagA family outer membrane protein
MYAARSSAGILLTTLFLLMGVCLVAEPAEAQQTGTIAGQVASAQGGQPLSAAQVFISDLDIGVLTQANGRFIMVNVPPGTHTVTAERIGYRVATAQVTISAGQTVVENFLLTEEALQLDEVIVTGTAGGSQRRAIGNVVDALDIGAISASAPISTVEDALIGRTPGVHLIPQNAAGGGSKIRIRGHSSLALGGDPIIYVDGVRLNDNRTEVGRFSNMSRLADFDPNTIESIEIIKGPAAATLYGTEASSGVIQIVTRRGQAGAPVFEFSTEVGQNYWPDWEGYNRVAWAPNPLQGCSPAALPCANESQLIAIDYAQHNIEQGFMDPWQNGLVQRYNASVRGGTDLIRYSFALSRSDQDGVNFWNTDERNSVTANLGVTASEKVSVQLTGTYSQGVYRPPESFWAGEYGWGGIPTGYFRPPDPSDPSSTWEIADCGDRIDPDCEEPENRGWRDGGPERYLLKRRDHSIASRRSTWSLQTNIDLTEWLSHRLTLGIDHVYEREETYQAREGTNFWWGTAGLDGSKSVSVDDMPVYTVDFSGTATFRLMGERLGTASSYGVQYYSRTRRSNSASGQLFAVPALSTVSGASIRNGSESFVENTTLGVYVQEQFDWENRIFLTAAVRGDDNSAFGKNYEAAIYPKVSATWVVHEESFWNVGWLEQLRLRGAWGQAGKQPDAFAASTLFEPETGPGSQPILTPDQFGNPDLGPEKGEELEVGFDASVLDGRVGASFTYYTRKTKDAIVGRTIPPSLWPGQAGAFAGGIQFVNLGQISSWGTETSLSIQAVDQGPVRLDLDVAFTTQGNRIDDMGEGVWRIQEGRSRAHYEGWPIAAASDQRIHSASFDPLTGDLSFMCDGGTGKGTYNADGDFVPLEIGGAPESCDTAPQLVWGPTDPTRLLNFTPTLTLFDDWRLTANIDAQWGHWVAYDFATARYTSHPSTKLNWLQDDALGMAYIQQSRNGLGFAKAGFAKLREVALTYTLPTSVTERIGASAASIRIGARNVARLWLQQEYAGDERLKYNEPVSDPEVTRGEYIFAGESGGDGPPIPQWTIRLGVTF